MTIKHLVFTGGGPIGLILYGAAKYLSNNNFWNIKNIKSIYGCSIGSLIGFLISLNYDWNVLDDFIIKRPWNKVLDNNINNIFEVYSKCGLMGEKLILDSMKSLLLAKNLDINITMKEFYDINNIELHFYSTKLNKINLEKIDISYKTFPNLEILTALRMSMAYPIVFEPVIFNDEFYIDGGILNNFPLNDCIYNISDDLSEILAFKKKSLNTNKIDNNNSNTIINNNINTDTKNIIDNSNDNSNDNSKDNNTNIENNINIDNTNDIHNNIDNISDNNINIDNINNIDNIDNIDNINRSDNIDNIDRSDNICNNINTELYSINNENNKHNLVNFIGLLVKSIQKHLSTETKQLTIDNIVNCTLDNYNINEWFTILSENELRVKLINIGIQNATDFLKIKSKNNNLLN